MSGWRMAHGGAGENAGQRQHPLALGRQARRRVSVAVVAVKGSVFQQVCWLSSSDGA